MSFPRYPFDETQLQQTRQHQQPTLRIYRFPEIAVVLGRASKVELELESAACSADRVAIYRRRGGGCAVVLDPGNLIVALGLPVPGLSRTRSTFDRITKWLVQGLSECGIVDVTSNGVSDLVVGEQKFGGSCLYRANGLLFYSVSLLVDPELSLLERYLKHPPREPDYRVGRGHLDFVVPLRRFLGSRPVETLEQRLNDVLAIGDLWPLRGADCSC